MDFPYSFAQNFKSHLLNSNSFIDFLLVDINMDQFVSPACHGQITAFSWLGVISPTNHNSSSKLEEVLHSTEGPIKAEVEPPTHILLAFYPFWQQRPLALMALHSLSPSSPKCEYGPDHMEVIKPCGSNGVQRSIKKKLLLCFSGYFWKESCFAASLAFLQSPNAEELLYGKYTVPWRN